ncbi:2-amino-4-hydroxy-6-hydroxymethyldihydropteridine diphosphokinase [Akkermansiaceae bacterium]|nr:2-amino-4-hydroxy-6-hydroxymethyldihydropteridine diphosphokinase [Akkermansiaceae bacterium]MDB4544610.1 2-amino-4-hydroxy-6-hydroxymethyldihydropteridine diphosphokinase [Akkermansiaceae bacterium]
MAIRTGISIGSNLGNRLANLRIARDMVVRLNPNDDSYKQSSIYQTDPVDCPPDSPDFYNAVVEIGYIGTPHDLLTCIQGIEWHLGRVATAERNAPRKIDLDILYFGNTVIDEDVLIIPHPRLTDRRFVLKPLADICPHLVLPGDETTVGEHLRQLDTDEPEPSLIQSMW